MPQDAAVPPEKNGTWGETPPGFVLANPMGSLMTAASIALAKPQAEVSSDRRMTLVFDKRLGDSPSLKDSKSFRCFS